MQIVRKDAIMLSCFTFSVNCDPPVSPQRGSLENYTNTTEGSEVFYSCDQGLVPEGRMRTVCTRNGWSPNPAELSCSVGMYECCNLVSAPALTNTVYYHQFAIAIPVNYLKKFS